MNKRTVTVVGGGLGGLACAALLADKGCAVTVLERGRELGGRARTTQEQGFALNFGPHALYRGGPGVDVLGGLGIDPGGRPPPSSGVVIKGDDLFELPASAASMWRSDLFGARSKLATALGLAKLSWADTARLEHVPLARWAEQAIADADARALILALGRVSAYAEAPEAISAGLVLRQLARVLRHGVIYLDGGWARLVDALAVAARARGVVIKTQARVTRVARAGDGWEVALGEHARRADELVLAVAPESCRELVPDEPAFAAAADTCRPVHAACLDLALDQRPIGSNFALGLDPAAYVSVHSDSARLGPPGGALVHAALYLPVGAPGARDADADRRLLEGVLERVLPGYAEHVVHARFLPKMVVSHRLYEAGPRPWFDPELPGLHAVGDWVGGPFVLLDAVLDSARRVSARVRGGRARERLALARERAA